MSTRVWPCARPTFVPLRDSEYSRSYALCHVSDKLHSVDFSDYDWKLTITNTAGQVVYKSESRYDIEESFAWMWKELLVAVTATQGSSKHIRDDIKGFDFDNEVFGYLSQSHGTIFLLIHFSLFYTRLRPLDSSNESRCHVLIRRVSSNSYTSLQRQYFVQPLLQAYPTGSRN